MTEYILNYCLKNRVHYKPCIRKQIFCFDTPALRTGDHGFRHLWLGLILGGSVTLGDDASSILKGSVQALRLGRANKQLTI